MTVADLVTRALQDLQVNQAGEVPTADDLELGRVTLNDWIDSLATEGLTIYSVTRQTWTLTPNVASYTIGVGALINVFRPVSPQEIHDIGYVDSSVTPLDEILFGGVLTIDQYISLPQKALTGVYPGSFYYNPTFGSTGFGTLYPFPVPTGASLLGVIYVPAPVTEFAAVTDVVSQPPGYRRFLRTNVAKELAAAFDAQVTGELQLAAVDSKANVKRVNERLSDLSCGLAGAIFGGGGSYDIWTDT